MRQVLKRLRLSDNGDGRNVDTDQRDSAREDCTATLNDLQGLHFGAKTHKQQYNLEQETLDFTSLSTQPLGFELFTLRR